MLARLNRQSVCLLRKTLSMTNGTEPVALEQLELRFGVAGASSLNNGLGIFALVRA